ncbi:hypothetical protein bcgnr5379_63710 [Bacillus cereus]
MALSGRAGKGLGGDFDPGPIGAWTQAGPEVPEALYDRFSRSSNTKKPLMTLQSKAAFSFVETACF